MSNLPDLFVKKLSLLAVAVLLFTGCGKNEKEGLPEVPKGNPKQVILTVNGKPVKESETDGKLGAYLFYNPYATDEQIKGARKTIAHSLAEKFLLDEKLKDLEIVLTEDEKKLAKKYLDFAYKGSEWVEKTAGYKNLPVEELYEDNLTEYKKMKILSCQPDIIRPTEAELDLFIKENRDLLGQIPQRKSVWQILTRHNGQNDPESLRKAEEKLKKALKDLREGKDFFETARQYSDLDAEDPINFLGPMWEECSAYGEDVAEIVRELNPGEWSDIYRGENNSFSVFYVKDILPEEQLPEKEMRSWFELLLILQKNEIQYYLLFEDLFENADIVYSAEYDTVPEM